MRTTIGLLAIFAGAAVAHMEIATAQQLARTNLVGSVQAIDPANGQITLHTDDGKTVNITPHAGARFLRLPPGEKSLASATPMTANDIGPGDRVLARGELSDDETLLAASTLVVMTKADIANKQQADQSNPAVEPGLYATINTSMGAIAVKFFEQEAPITVKNFVALTKGTKEWRDPKTGQMVKRPLYPGTVFHRVIPNFMIQGGDPLGTGMGDPGFTIPDEYSPSLNFDVPGRLAMANIGQPHTGGCQFFITEAPAPHLNGKHTIFGQVIEGQDIVTRIAYAPRNAEDKPLTPVDIVSISIKREGPPPAPRGVPAEPAPTPIEPPPRPPSDPTEISEGQTIDQVAAALGQPLKKAKVGTKEIYYYKDLKVTFVNGKVKDVQ